MMPKPDKQIPPTEPAALRRKKIIAASLIASLAAALFAGLLLCPASCSFFREKPDILLVSIDTARADAFGAYAAAGNPTPNFDRLAKEGVRFEQALTPVPVTLPAHVTMLSGFLPPWHGVHHNGIFVVPEGLPALAGILREQGWETAAVVGSFVLDRKFGLARGFDYYNDEIVPPGSSGMVGLHYAEIPADKVTDRALSWLSRKRRRPWFLFLHYYDPHHPYHPPSRFGERFPDNPYQAEIAFVDFELGRILSFLKEKGRLDKTLIIVTSDHGEGLGEHGEVTHGIFIYDTTLKVPWVMRWPGRIPAGKVVKGTAGLEDLAPTVLSLLRIKTDFMGHGKDLSPAILKGEPLDPARPFYAETYLPRYDFRWSELLGLRKGGWKFILAPRPELYDLKSDPKETRNLYEKEKGRAMAMKAELMKWIPRQGIENANRTVDDATRKFLRSLGYVGAGIDRVSKEAEKRDPKDYAHFLVPLYAGYAAKDRGEYDKAAALFQQALDMDPVNIPIRLLIADCLVSARKYKKASSLYREILSSAGENTEALSGLARTYLAMGLAKEALPLAKKAAELSPQDRETWALLGEIAALNEQKELTEKACAKLRALSKSAEPLPRFCGK